MALEVHARRARRLAVAVLPLCALGALLLAPTFPARAQSDLDRDGLDDAEERRLVANHLPWFRFDPGESDPSAAIFLPAGDPRDTLLGSAPDERLATSCAWPTTPRRRGLALVRVTPAEAYEPMAWDPGASPPGLRAVSGSVDGARIAEQAQRRGYVVARAALLFANDCGGTGRRVGRLGRGVNAHAGDAESISISLVRDTVCLPPEQGGATPGGDGWRVLEVVMSAHTGSEGLGLPWESVTRQRIDACDYGARFEPRLPEVLASGAPDALAWDDAWNERTGEAPAALRAHRNVVWIAMWKHGLYSSRAACNAGMPLPLVGPVEECRDGGFLQAFDVANVGEPEDPIDPDDPLNEPDAREAGRFATLFPGEGAWAIPPPSAPGALDGGFCGGFDRAKLVAAGRSCMMDVIRHPLEGVVSIVGDGLWPGFGGCPDGERCHRLLLPAAPPPERQPPFLAQILPRRGPATGGTAVTLTGGFPPDLCRLRFGESAVARVPRPKAFATSLRVTLPPGPAGRSVPVTLETCDGLRSLDTTPGTAGWFEYRAPAPATAGGSSDPAPGR